MSNYRPLLVSLLHTTTYLLGENSKSCNFETENDPPNWSRNAREVHEIMLDETRTRDLCDNARVQLFKGWITLSTGEIDI